MDPSGQAQAGVANGGLRQAGQAAARTRNAEPGQPESALAMAGRAVLGRRPAPGHAIARDTYGGPSAAATVFAKLTLLPTLALMAWLLAGLPLLLAGRFTAPLVSGTAAAVALVLGVIVLAWAPARLPRRRTPWWTVAALVAIAVGFGVWQGLMRSEQVIVRRDPASYLQFAYWIAHHGSLPVPQLSSAFGGTAPGLSFGSLGFYSHGGAVVPQFMAGLPMTLAAAIWIKGIQLAVLAAPVFGACAVLTFGGLVGRLCGARWAPLGALVLALSLPEVYTSRSTFSEPLAQVLLLGGLCLAIDALSLTAVHPKGVGDPGTAGGPGDPRSVRGEIGAKEARGKDTGGDPGEAGAGRAAGAGGAGGARSAGALRQRRAGLVLAALGGLALGLSVLVRIDGISDILPVILFCGILLALRRPEPAALPMAAGLAVGAGYGLADGYLLSRPYLDSLSPDMRALAYATAGFAGVTIVLAAAGRLWRLPRLTSRRWRWLPDTAAVVAVAIMVGFAVRPLVQTVRGETNPVTVAFIAEVQKLAHLPIDPHRTYAEDSLYWVIWYIGLPAVLLATFGAALLTRRFLRGSALIWGLPVMVIGWSAITTLWRPGIVPDQPWASRRLVPMVLPGLVLLAVWACAWLVERARERDAGRMAQGAVVGCCALALLLPAAVTTFGLGVERAPDGRLKAIADGLAFKRTDKHEIGVANGLCRAIGPNASVLIVDPLTADRFTEIVRAMCGMPAARMDSPNPAAVAQVVSGIQRAGRRPVLLAGTASELTPYGGVSHRIVYRAARQDEHRLTQPPTTTWRILYQIWMSTPG